MCNEKDGSNFAEKEVKYFYRIFVEFQGQEYQKNVNAIHMHINVVSVLQAMHLALL